MDRGRERWIRLRHQHAEGLGVKRRRFGGWERHARGRRERARLGPQQRSLLHWEGGHQHILPEIQLSSSSKGTSPRSQTFSQLFSRGRVETGQTERCFTDRHAFNVVKWVVRDDAPQDGPPDLSVTLVHHVNTISPTAPVSCVPPTRRCATPILPVRGAMMRSAMK